jgi:hypothetical protein
MNDVKYVKMVLKEKVLTRNDFFDIEECECGKPVWKYHNVSKNTHVMKCANTKYEIDIKTRKWTLSKKQPCNLYNVYHAERPIIAEIKKKVIIPYIKPLDFEKRLQLLFDFLFVSNHSSTIQEIDLIVKNNLKREPRKTFYYPSIGHLRVSHRESYEDYRDRIFSEKIVDRTTVPVIKEPVIKIPVIKIPVVKKPVVKKPVVKEISNDFVDVSDSDVSDTESQNSREYSDSDSDKENSDYTDENSNFSAESEQDVEDSVCSDYGDDHYSEYSD